MARLVAGRQEAELTLLLEGYSPWPAAPVTAPAYHQHRPIRPGTEHILIANVWLDRPFQGTRMNACLGRICYDQTLSMENIRRLVKQKEGSDAYDQLKASGFPILFTDHDMHRLMIPDGTTVRLECEDGVGRAYRLG